ncbi:MAG: hypothetical protein AB1498_04910 [bacterium]
MNILSSRKFINSILFIIIAHTAVYAQETIDPVRKYPSLILSKSSMNGSREAQAFSNGVDENALFSSQEIVAETTGIVDAKIIEEEKKTVNFSGEVTAASQYTLSRDKDAKDNSLASLVYANFFLDARLKKGTKYFANLELLNNASGSNNNDNDFLLSFRESFIDFNIKNTAYFRTGKQVIQWGRCYLWNPSDVINVEKKPFIKKIGYREGTYGMKIHVPFGTKYNIYSFIDTKDAKDIDEPGLAFKYEFILKKTEMAFSAWGKKGFKPVYAYDFSARISGIDTVGEAAFSRADIAERLKEENGILSKFREGNKWIPRASINFGRQFDFMDISDRISVNMEFYYNRSGYKENLFGDAQTYTFAQPVTVYDSSGVPVVKTSGTKKDFLLDNNLYQANYHSRYYAALFTSVRKFIISDLTLTLNLIGNLNDKSSILTTGVTYTDINDFSLGFNVYSYLGHSNREYTYLNDLLAARVTIGVVF